jgi:uncharacterized protein YuzE
MKIHYYKETDSLYIDLSEKKSKESREIAAGVVADFDEAGNLVGLDIDHASVIAKLDHIEMDALPLNKAA